VDSLALRDDGVSQVTVLVTSRKVSDNYLHDSRCNEEKNNLSTRPSTIEMRGEPSQ